MQTMKNQDSLVLESPLQYLPDDATKEWYYWDQERPFIVRTSTVDVNGVRTINGSHEERSLQVKKCWDKSQRTMIYSGPNFMKFQKIHAALLCEGIKNSDTPLEYVVEHDRNFYQKLRSEHQGLICAREVEKPEWENFVAIIRYLPPHIDYETRERTIQQDGPNEFNPGTTPGKEGILERRYSREIGLYVVESIKGLYSATGEHLIYQRGGDKSILFEFINRNDSYFGQIISLAQNMRADAMREDSVTNPETRVTETPRPMSEGTSSYAPING